ncbi:hypothetical protein [Haloarcula litorea]|uniref:DUF7859 family protein n=1 Tax=Haloarcula litorea TaxID=3032579 RepID=UPI0023E7C606|nr:hypothetical protein [Halomicroarcula sp. GDY20]
MTGPFALALQFGGLETNDLFIYGILAAVLGFFFFMYLMLRRTLLGFKEGYQQNKK